MDNQEAIKWLREAEILDLASGNTKDREAVNMAISALQAQEVKVQLPEEGTTPKVKKTCITCKHNSTSNKKWPCVDCDMREPADRWEPKEAKNSKESSLTQKALDTINRQQAIDALVKAIRNDPYYDSNERINGLGVCDVRVIINDLPSAQPEIIHCRDCIHAIKDGLCGGYWCKGKAVKSSHFCGYAERRTDDQSK